MTSFSQAGSANALNLGLSWGQQVDRKQPVAISVNVHLCTVHVTYHFLRLRFLWQCWLTEKYCYLLSSQYYDPHVLQNWKIGILLTELWWSFSVTIFIAYSSVMQRYCSTNWSQFGPFCSRALTVFSFIALSLLKFSHWTISQASTPSRSWDHRPRVLCFITAMEASLEADKWVGQSPSQANPQALEFPECHSLSAAKALLIKKVEFIVH